MAAQCKDELTEELTDDGLDGRRNNASFAADLEDEAELRIASALLRGEILDTDELLESDKLLDSDDLLAADILAEEEAALVVGAGMASLECVADGVAIGELLTAAGAVDWPKHNPLAMLSMEMMITLFIRHLRAASPDVVDERLDFSNQG